MDLGLTRRESRRSQTTTVTSSHRSQKRIQWTRTPWYMSSTATTPRERIATKVRKMNNSLIEIFIIW